MERLFSIETAVLIHFMMPSNADTTDEFLSSGSRDSWAHQSVKHSSTDCPPLSS
jgi:hypothetical protein